MVLVWWICWSIQLQKPIGKDDLIHFLSRTTLAKGHRTSGRCLFFFALSPKVLENMLYDLSRNWLKGQFAGNNLTFSYI